MTGLITIDKVEAFCPSGAQGVDINMPEPGQRIGLYALQTAIRLRGLSESGAEAEVRANGRSLRRWALQADPGGGALRLDLIVAALDLPARFDLEIHLCRAGGPVLICRIQGARGTLVHAPSARCQPLLLASLGRSGSTLLMQYLSGHPEILCHRTYPLETKIGQFATQMAALQTRPADLRGGTANPGVGRSANPFLRPEADSFPILAGPVAETALRSAVSQTEQFYDGVAAQQGKTAGAATIFAEKVGLDPEIPALMEALFGTCRRILLVRDFRDVIASVLAFNAKRGYAAFGREGVTSDLDYVARMGQYARATAAYAATLHPGCVLRYEDLLRDPAASLAGLFQALGLRHDRAALDLSIAGARAGSEEIRFHRTSKTEAASVGRWRQDLSAALQQAMHNELTPALASFGYETRPDIEGLPHGA